MTKNAMVTRAERIASEFLQAQVKASYPILDRGMVNQVCVVETDRHKVVIRMNDKGTYSNYVKEQWCIEQSAAAGVSGPEVLAIGVLDDDDIAYMIQTFVEGENGLDSKLPKSEIWRQLGHYVKLIHTIPAKGYGENLKDPVQGEWYSPPHPGSDGTWQGYLQHNINSLTERDSMISLGVIKPTESWKVQQIFENIKLQTLRFGLTHGDLSLKNTIIDPAGQVALIDWGNAAVSPVPHGDIINLLQHQMIEQGLNDEEFQAFLDGYGLHGDVLVLTRRILLLKTFDNLRWAIDRAPDRIEDFTKYAKQAIQLLKDKGEFA